VSDGRHAASIALLGNYMAGNFVTAADGHGGTLLTEASQLAQAPMLAQPRPGDDGGDPAFPRRQANVRAMRLL
jgi:hypothetical protein